MGTWHWSGVLMLGFTGGVFALAVVVKVLT